MLPDLTDVEAWQLRSLDWSGSTNEELVLKFLEVTAGTDRKVKAIIEARLTSEMDRLFDLYIRKSYPAGGRDIATRARESLLKSLRLREADAVGLSSHFARTIWRRATDAVRRHLAEKLDPTPDIDRVVPGALHTALEDPHLAAIFAMSLSRLVDDLDPLRRRAFEMTLYGYSQGEIAVEVKRSTRTIRTWQDEFGAWLTVLQQRGLI